MKINQLKTAAKKNGTLDQLKSVINASEWQRGYGYQKGKRLEIDWSPDFKRWRALVLFSDGYECWTYPKAF